MFYLPESLVSDPRVTKVELVTIIQRQNKKTLTIFRST